MAQLVNKVLFKYIMLLLLVFVSSITLVLSTHLFFHKLIHELENKSLNLKAKIDISEYLLDDITFLHLHLLELTAVSRSPEQRAKMIEMIKDKVSQAEGRLYIINHGGKVQRTLSKEKNRYIILSYTNENPTLEMSSKTTTVEIQLDNLAMLIANLTYLLDQRDQSLANENTVSQDLVKKIRTFNLNLTKTFEELKSDVQTLILTENQNYLDLQEKSAQKEAQYDTYEFLIIILTGLIVLFLLYKILKHIVHLYKEMEHQLYIDALTKLKNRFSLLKDIKNATNPSVVIIDINGFRTINELYGVNIGNEVLITFANVLKQFAKNKDFQVYRIAGDEFVFFKDSLHVSTQECIHLLDAFFTSIEDKKIYIPEIDDFIYLELSAGVSFDKKNTLGTADMALNKAKELHKQYVFYHNAMDSLNEIKQGAWWKKRIIHGIENSLFLPFFQPIVDRDSKIIKYEALMRLKREEEGIVSFISPLEFLEVASKTKHYNQISQMMLLKSLEVCSRIDEPISLNLNYQDILNKPLHEKLKQAILNYDIGKKVIFEIVESQSIQSYKLLRNFIAEFKTYGVRFAIDDFGTGFSNFTHIFELSPDFIKIDGSLIKNIHTDKKSYELVKAIVFFSKELDIKTIAEFVHSKEVFDIALKLGVDQFQGYYFSEPKETI